MARHVPACSFPSYSEILDSFLFLGQCTFVSGLDEREPFSGQGVVHGYAFNVCVVVEAGDVSRVQCVVCASECIEGGFVATSKCVCWHYAVAGCDLPDSFPLFQKREVVLEMFVCFRFVCFVHSADDMSDHNSGQF